MPLELNKKAPAFTLPDQNGKKHSLKDYLGQKVLLYIYPKDNTPGCTKEACNFRDAFDVLKEEYNVQVLGLSADSVESHEKFASKFSLNFPILADPDKKVLTKYNVWREKKNFGKVYMGIHRESFLIDEQGKLIKHYKSVKAAQHAEQVLKFLEKLKEKK